MKNSYLESLLCLMKIKQKNKEKWWCLTALNYREWASSLYNNIKDLMNDAAHTDSSIIQKMNIKTESFYTFFVSLSSIKQHTIEILLSLLIK